MKDEDLPLLPWLMAETVCSVPYNGKEFSLSCGHPPKFVAEIEKRRLAMTQEQINTFCDEVDARCKLAFNKKVPWFMSLVKAPGNKGRDSLRNVFIPHWLGSFLAKQEPRIFP